MNIYIYFRRVEDQSGLTVVGDNTEMAKFCEKLSLIT